MTPEFSRTVRLDEVGAAVVRRPLEATEAERALLAARFGLVALDRLHAALDVRRDAAGIRVSGTIEAAGAQTCVLTGSAVGFVLSEPCDLLFVESGFGEAEEIELGAHELDLLPVEGGQIDLGEAVAQTLLLALDPYPRASGASVPGVLSEDEAAREASPFAKLGR